MLRRISIFWGLWCGLAAAALGAERAPADKAPVNKAPVNKAPADKAAVDYSRDVLPILAQACYTCHGPGEKDRQAGLRLDTPAGATQRLPSGQAAVVPGDSGHSELIRRLTSSDPDERMPPADSGPPLAAGQIALLRQWIDQGAVWKTHWSLVRPVRPLLPAVKRSGWVRTPIDRFILARLEKEGLAPAAEADHATLLRRVTLDLTGLPPTLEELDRFAADPSPDAYERAVDRLLASPRYGERMAVPWLDLARYADTHGYHTDSHRDMWRWRQWVIEALNANLPFDQFTIEQTAGDLLPGATLDQRIATGFHRNHMINFEGGALAEEYLLEYRVDRVSTLATAWLGLTLACTRCHEHKFDPFSQRDFYRLMAYFSNVPEQGLDGRKGNAEPWIKAPRPEQAARLAELDRQLDQAKQELARYEPAADRAQTLWERQLLAGGDSQPRLPADLAFYFSLDDADGDQPADDSQVERRGAIMGQTEWAAGKFAGALLFDGRTAVELKEAGAFDRGDPFTCAAWVFPTTQGELTILAQGDDPDGPRWQWLLVDSRPTLRLIGQNAEDALEVTAKTALALSRWQHVAVAYDGSGTAQGVQLYIAGRAAEVDIARDMLRGSTRGEGPLRIGRSDQSAGFRGILDEVRGYARSLSAAEVALLAAGDPLADLASIPAGERSPSQREKIRRYYRQNHDAGWIERDARREKIQHQRDELDAAIPTTMVLQDVSPPRETFLYARGDYRYPTEKVAPGVPAVLLPADPAWPPNRLGLARWLVDPAHPLTARVAANRAWQNFFGRGIVATPEDFGTRGQPPSHPELLDWLAVELIHSGWNMKRLDRLIVTSSVYRQASDASGEQQARDPHNVWLSHSPRLRLPAEAIRDAALFAAGLLDARLGGPSVFPYQPAGLWDEVSFDPKEFSAQVYVESQGADLYRRGLYTFWKRTVPPPSLALFDAPSREVCTAGRERTNTPLQALALLNDPTYLEAARRLAQRVLQETAGDDDARIAHAFRLVASRRPDERELAVFRRVLVAQREHYQARPGAALLLLDVGESPRDASIASPELASWTILASMILNHSEAITRN